MDLAVLSFKFRECRGRQGSFISVFREIVTSCVEMSTRENMFRVRTMSHGHFFLGYCNQNNYSKTDLLQESAISVGCLVVSSLLCVFVGCLSFGLRRISARFRGDNHVNLKVNPTLSPPLLPPSVLENLPTPPCSELFSARRGPHPTRCIQNAVFEAF